MPLGCQRTLPKVGEPGQVTITDGPYLVFIIILNGITWGPSVMGTWPGYPKVLPLLINEASTTFTASDSAVSLL